MWKPAGVRTCLPAGRCGKIWLNLKIAYCLLSIVHYKEKAPLLNGAVTIRNVYIEINCCERKTFQSHPAILHHCGQ
jgi:hypothetical protein